MEFIQSQIDSLGPMFFYIASFVVVGILVILGQGFLKAHKIQPKGFSWKVFRHEMFWAAITIFFSSSILIMMAKYTVDAGWVTYNQEPAAWWVIAYEYALYFLLFDTYFYWGHRLMHVPGIYEITHKTHHRSMSPNLLTTFSVNPIESIVNGIFVTGFTMVFTVHVESYALIGPTAVLMGLYVHSGYEFLPSWWNKTWLTKWFIPTSFHDQHHRFYTGNYGGYTTIWDRLMGTMRPNYEKDFERIVERRKQPVVPKTA